MSSLKRRSGGAETGNRPTGVRCPRYDQCGGEVVYNGNYFCDQLDAGRCTYAMGEQGTPEEEFFFRACYQGLMNGGVAP